MKFHVGIIDPCAEVEVTNRQQHVEFKIISGYASESDIRASVGNYGRNQYEPHYSGYYASRKISINRLESEIERTKEYLAGLEFSLKVTKKRNWKLAE
ncbi:coil containing protein [Vibrio phage 1.029.O._10N.261.55.A7]|nr:coil containing protein [Vibrio phage 1.029.O._10N.261.55.A7]